VSDADGETNKRNREIAQNEAERQTVGDIRVSAWAIAACCDHRTRRRRLGAAAQQLEHDPEKWAPVFRKDHAQTKR